MHDQNNEEIIASFVSVSSLIEGEMDSNGVYTVELDKENGIFLEFVVYNGDLNNLAGKNIEMSKKK